MLVTSEGKKSLDESRHLFRRCLDSLVIQMNIKVAHVDNQRTSLTHIGWITSPINEPVLLTYQDYLPNRWTMPCFVWEHDFGWTVLTDIGRSSKVRWIVDTCIYSRECRRTMRWESVPAVVINTKVVWEEEVIVQKWGYLGTSRSLPS